MRDLSSRFRIRTWIERDNAELEVTVIGRYSPPRPPPLCSDHDSPQFYDCGDPEEFEVHEVLGPDGKSTTLELTSLERDRIAGEAAEYQRDERDYYSEGDY